MAHCNYFLTEYINKAVYKFKINYTREAELINCNAFLNFRLSCLISGNYKYMSFFEISFEAILGKQVFNDKKLLNIQHINTVLDDSNKNNKQYGGYRNKDRDLNLLIFQLLFSCKWKNQELQRHLLKLIYPFNLTELGCVDLHSLYKAGNEDTIYLKIKEPAKSREYKELIVKYSKLYSIIYKAGFSLKQISAEFNYIPGGECSIYEGDQNIFAFIRNILSQYFRYDVILFHIYGRIKLLKNIFKYWEILKNNLNVIEYTKNDFEAVVFSLSVNILPEDNLIWFTNKIRFGETWHENTNDKIYSCFLVASKFYKELRNISSHFTTCNYNARLASLVKNFGIEMINNAIYIVQPVYDRKNEEKVIQRIERTAKLLKLACPYETILPVALREGNNLINEVKIVKLFKEKYNRIPHNKILLPILDIARGNIEIGKYIVNNFHYKSVIEVINSREPVFCELELYYRLKLICLFGNKWKNIIQQIIKASHISQEEPKYRMHSFISSLSGEPFLNPELRKWLENNAGANKELISNICNCWNIEDFPRNGTTRQMRKWIKQHKEMSEYEKCKQKWPKLGWGTFSCELPMTKTTYAEVLDPNDPRMVYVGIITHCCQRRNGFAEKCMVTSLTHPRSSVLVFYHKKYKDEIIAFAWIWDFSKKGENILVLDNIELAEQRDLEYVLPSLREWSMESPYGNIQLGTGYSAGIVENLPEVTQSHMGWLSNYNGYSDAGKRVWIKFDGQVLI